MQATPDETRPRFTIGIPVELSGYAAIEVLSQSFTDFEYVIVDDGSTDTQPRWLLVITSTNSLFSKANQMNRHRNRVVAESSGAYILWMADDDRLAPGIPARYHQALLDDPTLTCCTAT